MQATFSSKALEVNLASTRKQQVTIPERHQQFIALSASHWGIHQRIQDFMVEYHHPYSNRDYVVEHLRKIALNDLWFYSSLDDAEQAFIVIADIFRDLLGVGLKAAPRERAFQTLCEFTGNLAQRAPLPDNAVQHCLTILDETLLQEENELIFIRNSGYFKTHFHALAQTPQHTQQVCLLTKTVLENCLNFWEKTSKAEHWFQHNENLFTRNDRQHFHAIGGPFFSRLQQQLQQATTWQELMQCMFFQDIANHFRRFVEQFSTPLEKIYFIFYLLRLPGMESLKDQLLWDMNRLLRIVLDTLNNEQTCAFLENVSRLFQDLAARHMRTVLDCMLTLGKQVIATADRQIIHLYVEKLIHLGFVFPGTVQITNDWELEIDSCHIKNIRVWLELIESAPTQLKPLLSALIVNLSLGGIFISDTDLFQRDITKLLNSNIAPLYKQIKQLTRIFPVYFNEIGAEGELRDETTAVDELSGRHDLLLHFFRKSVHTESNNTHVELARSILQYWYDGQKEALRAIVPSNVLETLDVESEWFTSVHEILVALCRQNNWRPEELLDIETQEFNASLAAVSSGNEREKKRLRYLVKIHLLLREKYSLETKNIIHLLRRYRLFEESSIQELKTFLDKGENDQALGHIYKDMDKLKKIILNPEPSEGWENIYHKRHIAAGIPSMYGQYHETKFEALGVTFRLEKLASRLLEKIIQEINLDYVTAKTLRRVCAVLEFFKEGLRLDGIGNQGFDSTLKMFQYSLKSTSFSLAQHVNIFQFLADNVKEIITEYFFRVYDPPLKTIVPQLCRHGGCCKDEGSTQLIHKKSEQFYREILSSAFLLQTLDNFIVNVLQALQSTVDSFSDELIHNVMSYDPDLSISPLYKETLVMDNPVFLGAKAYFLKKLHKLEFPIPFGFVLTSELFRHRNAVLKHKRMTEEIDQLIQRQLSELERLTGKEFGSPKNPLLLSVRSGGAISMPGAMNTFLNVGMNDKIVEALSRQPNYYWTSWDCYRRFLQSWGMAYGLDREIFDQIIIHFKAKYRVEQKIRFTPAQMRTIAYAYKKALHAHDIHFEDEPFLQLKQAILHVMESWDSERAQVYRKHLQIADEWGTAVIVQKMVLGNIQYTSSGTGVLFTHDPNNTKPGVHLYGDFTLCSQGEDIVGGLVHTLPLTEEQRKRLYDKDINSLQSLVPKIYDRLLTLSNQLVEEQGFNHQEIEFTFESHHPEDLYILQTRDQDIREQHSISIFSDEQTQMEPVGRGIGIGGGALNGIIAFDEYDLDLFSKQYPNDARVLVRPDTIPDDIGMIFECDGLLTGRGGATSHAAVTAVRLGKVCIVNCKDLHVDKIKKRCNIDGTVFTSGDKIAIDGRLGNIYSGHYVVENKEIRYNE